VEYELGSLKDEKSNGTLGKNSPVKCEETMLKIEVFLCVEWLREKGFNPTIEAKNAFENWREITIYPAKTKAVSAGKNGFLKPISC